MLEIATVTFKAFGKVRFKDIVIPSQNSFFVDYDVCKRACVNDPNCNDFLILNIKFRKVEVLQ